MMTRPMFFKKVFELIKRDDSFLNCIHQVIHEHELDPTEVGEWVKEDKTMMENVSSEFKIRNKMNDLF